MRFMDYAYVAKKITCNNVIESGSDLALMTEFEVKEKCIIEPLCKSYVFSANTYELCAEEGPETKRVNTYSYPEVPKVHSVEGCRRTQGNGTADCPTNGARGFCSGWCIEQAQCAHPGCRGCDICGGGPILLTVAGTHFGHTPTIFVGGKLCSNPQLTTLKAQERERKGLEFSRYTCLLPEGRGLNQMLEVKSNPVIFSALNPLVSFAPPFIKKISQINCEVEKEDWRFINCNNEGGTIRVDGVNFGHKDMKIVIGDTECQSLQHEPTNPHKVVTCEITGGFHRRLPVTAVQINGLTSTDNNYTGFHIPTLSYKQCPKGTYQTDTSCVVCPNGTISTREGTVYCIECPVGSHANELRTDCVLCEKGWFNYVTAQTKCRQCPGGYYATGRGSTECKPCEPGKYTSQPGAEECELCETGRYKQLGGAGGCEDCRPGTFSFNKGQSQCESCPRGFFTSRSGQKSCERCPQGRANDQLTQYECAPCRRGEFAAQLGQQTCTKCQPGTFSPSTERETECESCPEGKFQSAEGVSYCGNCEPGTFASGSKNLICRDCPRGKICRDYNCTQCDLCAKGKYTDIEHSTVCRTCPKNTEGPERGLAECLPCDPGKENNRDVPYVPVNDRGAPVPVLADCNEFATENLCPPGLCRWKNDACVGCSEACELTGAKYFHVHVHNYTCECGEEPTLLDNWTSYEFKPASCTKCPKGSAKTETATNCSICEAGTYTDTLGAPECLKAPKRTYVSEANSSVYHFCKAGTYADEEGLDKCKSCQTGKYSKRQADICLPCQPGTHEVNNTCIDCAIGRYQDKPEKITCEECESGKSNSRVGQRECPACPPGKYKSNGTINYCLGCAVGKYADKKEGNVECEQCEKGKYQILQGASSCKNCKLGRYQNATGQSKCRPCEAGKFYGDANVPSEQCHPCKAGTENFQEEQQSCSSCKPGFYKAEDSISVCISCEAGKYQDLYKGTTCKSCEAGKFDVGAIPRESCEYCAVGRYQNNEQQTECIKCMKGERSTTGKENRTQCMMCPKGKTSTDEAGTCFDCPAGKHTGEDGMAACVICDGGRFSNDTGKHECSMCPPGRYNDLDTQTVCFVCAKGTYQDKTTNATRCTQCEKGKYGGSEGLHVCEPCERGKKVDLKGQKICDACPPGYSTRNLTQQTTCSQCLSGTFAHRSGAHTCQACPAGKRNTNDGAMACVNCPAGQWQNETNQTDCNVCPAGRANDQSGGTTDNPTLLSTNVTGCYDCPKGKYSLASSPKCSPCTDGKVNNKVGLASCVDCKTKDKLSIPDNKKELCICPDQYYSTARTEDEIALNNFTCEKCPPGAKCKGAGTTVASMEVREGFWRENTESAEIQKCLLVEHCLGGYNVGDCGTNREGILCAKCKDGYESTTILSPCSQCPDQSTSLAVAIVLGLIFILILVLIIVILLKMTNNAIKIIIQLEHKIIMGTGVPVGDDMVLDANGDIMEDDGVHFMENNPLASCDLDQSTVDLLEDDINGVHLTFSPSNDAPPPPPPPPPVPDVPPPPPDEEDDTLPIGPTPEDADDPPENLHARSFSLKISVSNIDTEQTPPPDPDDDTVPTGPPPETSDGPSEMNLSISNTDTEQATTYLSDTDSEANLSDDDDQSGFAEQIELHMEKVHRQQNNQVSQKFKIMVSFIQVTTNLVFIVDAPWPTLYTTFLQQFDFLNLNFIPWQSVGCVTSISYYDKFWITALVPSCIGLIIFLSWLHPFLGSRKVKKRMEDPGLSVGEKQNLQFQVSAFKMRLRKFQRIFIMCLFSLYPSLSSTVLRLFVCREILGKHYLHADYNLFCYTSEWWKMLPWGVFFGILYPLGIPYYFYWLVKRRRNKRSLQDPRVKFAVGWIYEAFIPRVWYFEVVEMSYKLTITSVLGFLPHQFQVQAALAVVGAYTILILIAKPYHRSGDDTLHLLVQAETFCLVTIVLTLDAENYQYDPVMDAILSILLIVFTCSCVILFVCMIARIGYKEAIRQIRKGILKRQDAAKERHGQEESCCLRFCHKVMWGFMSCLAHILHVAVTSEVKNADDHHDHHHYIMKQRNDRAAETFAENLAGDMGYPENTPGGGRLAQRPRSLGPEGRSQEPQEGRSQEGEVFRESSDLPGKQDNQGRYSLHE